ncbi:hypothetical protein SAMN04515671_3889 [Nakamurella panacisegetis]|uniref:IrrE N-terminal-like domain-containing protein n=1 Tax=Nakamurella panacisegetis TaxID=1090615 RepID=A0A1H0S3U6_9ACTN|nr:hypothetical protein [Nakamurella panacisegetis]SDP36295.1 hypothetical protein SAMN04515671_3889 [Nakamurella panacisegetis]
MSTDTKDNRPTPAAVLELLTGIAPEPWDPYVCLERLVELRGRPIVMAQAALPQDLVSTALRTETTDYVFIPPMDLGRDRSMIVTHGLAHLLLEHQMPDLDEWSLTARDRADGPYCGYSEEDEREAEDLAVAFVDTLTMPATYENGQQGWGLEPRP